MKKFLETLNNQQSLSCALPPFFKFVFCSLSSFKTISANLSQHSILLDEKLVRIYTAQNSSILVII
jgi:hypothetical protein